MSEFYRLDVNPDLWIPVAKKITFQEDVDWANIIARELEESQEGKGARLSFSKKFGQKVEGKIFKYFGKLYFVTETFLAVKSSRGKTEIWPRVSVEEIVNL
jgi:hypothetical protein